MQLAPDPRISEDNNNRDKSRVLRKKKKKEKERKGKENTVIFMFHPRYFVVVLPLVLFLRSSAGRK